MYAAKRPEAVSHLVMLNAMYGTPGAWSLRAALEDPARPGEMAPLPAYSRRDGRSLVGRWEATLPIEDKGAWRDPAVAAAYVAAAMAADPEEARSDPPKVRVPAGPLRDSYLLADGTRPGRRRRSGRACWWCAAHSTAGLGRRTSRRCGANSGGPAAVEIVELPGATHFVHLDQPERGRRELVAQLIAWLAA